MSINCFSPETAYAVVTAHAEVFLHVEKDDAGVKGFAFYVAEGDICADFVRFSSVNWGDFVENNTIVSLAKAEMLKKMLEKDWASLLAYNPITKKWRRVFYCNKIESGGRKMLLLRNLTEREDENLEALLSC